MRNIRLLKVLAELEVINAEFSYMPV